MKKYWNISRINMLMILSVFTPNFASDISIDQRISEFRQVVLSTGWQVRQVPDTSWLPAEVPGCVHLDLLNNGKIADPFYRMNERDIQWIPENDWEYRTTFQVNNAQYQCQQIDLVFSGLDTYADVYLNDRRILQADNMFRSWRVKVKPQLKKGENHLRIYFHSVFKINVPKWEEASFRLLAFPNNDQADVQINMYSRKAGYHFGWDWGPRLITTGIWRPVNLEMWDNVRFQDLQIYQDSLSQKEAHLRAEFLIEARNDTSLIIQLQDEHQFYQREKIKIKKGEHTYSLRFQIKTPQLWWCNGLGESYLYRFTGSIENGEQIVEQRSVNFGIRSLRVIRDADKKGRSFYIELNGYPVFMKGANYIPQDNFQSRATAERYEKLIRSVAEANMNMLRIWGGGIYEEDIFYDLCDRYGILIWQDLMFSCAMYPADESFLENVRQEITENVSRLRNHPCIALYCGNNENEISWYQWGWKSQFQPDIQNLYEKNLQTLFHLVIPAAVKQIDSCRYYHLTSPITGYNNISYSEGDVHYWGVWHGKEPFTYYEKNIGRFMSEYGFQSFPQMSTISKFTLPEDRYLDSEVMLSHQRCMADNRQDKKYGNRLIKEYLSGHYRTPKDFASFVYISQLLQAEGVKMAIEAHRRNKPYCMGSLYWQMNDCWPAASWASIDYYGNWKALHYLARKAYENVLVSPRLQGDTLQVFVISDLLTPLESSLDLEILDFSGQRYFQKNIPLTIPANSSRLVYVKSLKEILKGSDRRQLVLKSSINSAGHFISENNFYFMPVKELNLLKAEITKSIIENADGYSIALHSHILAKNVYLEMSGIEGNFTDNYFDLLPGEKKIVQFNYKGRIADPEEKLIILTIRDTF